MGHGKPLSEDIRKVIISSCNSGKSGFKNSTRPSPSEIYYTIYYIQHNKKTGKLPSLKKTGRPRITTLAQNRVLQKIIKQNRRARAGELTVRWREMVNKDVSVDTCKRVKKRMGYGFHTVKEKPLLTELQKKKRRVFALARQNWTIYQWRSIIRSDESKFEMAVGDKRKKIVHNKNEAFHNNCLKGK